MLNTEEDILQKFSLGLELGMIDHFHAVQIVGSSDRFPWPADQFTAGICRGTPSARHEKIGVK
jgi:hypothetical protein